MKINHNIKYKDKNDEPFVMAHVKIHNFIVLRNEIPNIELCGIIYLIY